MRTALAALLILLAACAPRGVVHVDPTARAVGQIEQIFVATSRGTDDDGTLLGRSRLSPPIFGRYDVSVPPQREAGKIAWPRAGQDPDPRRHFVLAGSESHTTPAAFRADLARSLRANGGEAVVFVHGYNNSFAEGLYRFAQMGHDLDLPGTMVHYSWPSRAKALAYAYDRDSALYARDGLEEMLNQIAASGARKIVIFAHSMGAALTMESLRQMAIGKNPALAKVSAVVLISPDIDVDVFRQQAHRIGKLPEPFLIFTSKRDGALRLAARLTGEKVRLGTLTDVTRVADLKVTLLDVTAFNAGHFAVGTSPALIKLLGAMGALQEAFSGESSSRVGLLASAFLSVRQATNIVLEPIGALTAGN